MNIEFKIKDLDFYQNSIPIYKLENKNETLNKIKENLLKICSLYFGVHPTQIQEDLIFLATKKIINEFNQISIEELVHAYDRIEIQRQVTLTIEDLLQPVKKYIFAKNYISAEQEKIQKQEIEEQITEQKKNRTFKNLRFKI